MSVRASRERRAVDHAGLCSLIERALDADIPVVIAVGKDHFADWIKFAGGMSVKLGCDRDALDAWLQAVSTQDTNPILDQHQTVCELLK